MKKSKSKFYLFLVKALIATKLLMSDVGFAEVQKIGKSGDDSYKRALISGWRFSLATGHSPFCFGEQREFGHYRCGSYTDFTAMPTKSEGLILKIAGHNLKATRLVKESHESLLKTWEVEQVELSTLQIGRMLAVGRAKAGISIGAGSGTIIRSKAEEDEFYRIKTDDLKKVITFSVYSASLMASYVAAQTSAGDLTLDMNQTWYATSGASNPRDERRVWASMPTLAIGWSYEFQ